jgi:hypothetical protein
MSVAGGTGRDCSGYHGLAAADIALQQAHHRHAAGEVGVGIGKSRRLRAGEREGQGREKALREARLILKWRRRIGPEGALAEFQRQVMGEQLLECEPSLRRMAAGGELDEPCAARWRVQILERLPQRGHSRRELQFCRQEVRGSGVLELTQCLGNEGAQPSLRHSLGERIDRCESLFECRGFLAHPPVLRMHHL